MQAYPTSSENDDGDSHASESGDSESVEIPVANRLPNDGLIDDSLNKLLVNVLQTIQCAHYFKKSKVSIRPINKSKKTGMFFLSDKTLKEIQYTSSCF